MNLSKFVSVVVLAVFNAQSISASDLKCGTSLLGLRSENLPPLTVTGAKVFVSRKAMYSAYSDAINQWAKNMTASQLKEYAFEIARVENGIEVLVALKSKNYSLLSSQPWSFKIRSGLITGYFENKDLVLFWKNSVDSPEYLKAGGVGLFPYRILQLESGAHLKVRTNSDRDDVVNSIDVEYFPPGAFEKPSTLIEATNNAKFKWLEVPNVRVTTQIENRQVPYTARRESPQLITLTASENLYELRDVTITFQSPLSADAAFLLLRELNKRKIEIELQFDENEIQKRYSRVYMFGEERWNALSKNTFVLIDGQSFRFDHLVEIVQVEGIGSEKIGSLFH